MKRRASQTREYPCWPEASWLHWQALAMIHRRGLMTIAGHCRCNVTKVLKVGGGFRNDPNENSRMPLSGKTPKRNRPLLRSSAAAPGLLCTRVLQHRTRVCMQYHNIIRLGSLRKMARSVGRYAVSHCIKFELNLGCARVNRIQYYRSWCFRNSSIRNKMQLELVCLHGQVGCGLIHSFILTIQVFTSNGCECYLYILLYHCHSPRTQYRKNSEMSPDLR